MMNFAAIGEVYIKEYGKAQVQVGRCPQSGQLAIVLADPDSGEPLAALSTNLNAYGRVTGPDSAGIKTWSENAPIIKPLLASGLFKDTGERVKAEYVEIPIWQLANPEHVPPMPLQRKRTR